MLLYVLCRNIKWFLSGDVAFTRKLSGEGVTSTKGHFVSPPLELHSDTQLDESFSSALEVLKVRIENFTHHSSGWKIQGLDNASVNIAPYSPIRAGAGVKYR